MFRVFLNCGLLQNLQQIKDAIIPLRRGLGLIVDVCGGFAHLRQQGNFFGSKNGVGERGDLVERIAGDDFVTCSCSCDAGIGSRHGVFSL